MFCILNTLVILHLGAVYSDDESLDYVYDDLAELQTKDSGGQRLVGASRGKTTDYPFLVAWTTDSKQEYVSCTGSLIQPQWFISAAHCILSIVQTKDLDECVNKSKKDGNYTSASTRLQKTVVKCSYVAGENIKIEFVDPYGMAYIGVDDLNVQTDIRSGIQQKIDYFVRHKQSYQGGGSYGTFGGYDITLVHMENPVPSKYTPACVPGLGFKDVGIGFDYGKGDVSLAGFGKYYRKKCLTDEYGPSKFHYCSESGCNKDDPPPISPFCKKFFSNAKTPSAITPGHEELLIYRKNTSLVYCFNQESPKNGSKGWCHVDNSARTIGEIKEHKSWGFCSRDCYLEDGEYEPWDSVIRYVPDVSILTEDICNRFLDISMGRVEHHPEIICVGHKRKPKYDLWRETKKGFKKVKRETFKHKVNHYLTRHTGFDAYYTSAGTCSGDSGGPVFTKDDTNRFVVLGAVSGGRGVLGDCGGFNNPTHYVRISKMVDWIKEIMGEDAASICVSHKNMAFEDNAQV